jgi:prepilin-type N-terminal cleavage/methylation domain-containing protein
MKNRNQNRRGFTLLEALVATVIMGIAVSGILSAISESTRNAARLTQYDRATLLARQKMDELLVDLKLPRKSPMSGVWLPQQSGGVPAGWTATVTPFEAAPGTGPGQWVLDRVQLEIWWMDGTTRRALQLEGFRRGVLRPGDL